MPEILIVLVVIVILMVCALFIWLSPPDLPPRESVAETFIGQPRGVWAELVCIAGPQRGRSFPLKGPQVTLGRSPHSDVVVPADLVSWQHALIAYVNGQCIIYDQGSTNGVWVNGQRIAQHFIQPADQIQIGPSIFVLRMPGQVVEPTPLPIQMPSPPPAPSIAVHDIAEYELLDTRPGGVATVYKARSHRDGQIVALKVLHSQDPYIKDKFTKEIEVGKSLRHPHIVQVYGGGECQGRWYMVMEFVEGGTLRDRMRPGHPLPLDFAIQVTGQMCDALTYAHQRGVYHRDVKPENILCASERVTKLGDFGIAKLAQSVTRTARGMIIGTPLYMSFEQAKGHKIDHRTDIYSLGVVLYEMTTGRPPFLDEDRLKIVDMHIKDYPLPPRQINPAIPPQVEQVILRTLEKDRNRRFQTTEEMARALGYTAPMHLQGEAPVTTGPAGAAAAPAPALTYEGLQLVRFDNVVIPLRSGITPLNRQEVNSGDQEISRQHHAQAIYRDGYWWLQDTGSTNGTYVNGLRIFEPVMLQPGDEVRLGRTVLRVARG